MKYNLSALGALPRYWLRQWKRRGPEDDVCVACGRPLGRHYAINMTWAGGPPQFAWCMRWWCRVGRWIRRRVRLQSPVVFQRPLVFRKGRN